MKNRRVTYAFLIFALSSFSSAKAMEGFDQFVGEFKKVVKASVSKAARETRSLEKLRDLEETRVGLAQFHVSILLVSDPEAAEGFSGTEIPKIKAFQKEIEAVELLTLVKQYFNQKELSAPAGSTPDLNALVAQRLKNGGNKETAAEDMITVAVVNFLDEQADAQPVRKCLKEWVVTQNPGMHQMLALLSEKQKTTLMINSFRSALFLRQAEEAGATQAQEKYGRELKSDLFASRSLHAWSLKREEDSESILGLLNNWKGEATKIFKNGGLSFNADFKKLTPEDVEKIRLRVKQGLESCPEPHATLQRLMLDFSVCKAVKDYLDKNPGFVLAPELKNQFFQNMKREVLEDKKACEELKDRLNGALLTFAQTCAFEPVVLAAMEKRRQFTPDDQSALDRILSYEALMLRMLNIF